MTIRADHSPTVLINVVETAARKHKWRILGSIESPERDGKKQHGIALIERDGKTLYRNELRWGTVQWYRNEDGIVGFDTGHYDMDLLDATSDFVERSWHIIPEVAR